MITDGQMKCGEGIFHGREVAISQRRATAIDKINRIFRPAYVAYGALQYVLFRSPEVKLQDAHWEWQHGRERVQLSTSLKHRKTPPCARAAG